METPVFRGWVEVGGEHLSPDEVTSICAGRKEEILRFGGEFFLAWNGCTARDHFGIVQGEGPKGTLVCDGKMSGAIVPNVPDLSLEDSIITAVNLRSNEGVVALSGGVDSALVAKLAGRDCVAVGVEGSHDLRQARHAAEVLNLSCTYVTITEDEIAAALPEVVGTIPRKDPVSTGIALTQYFVARFAGEHGYNRILTGQGADELFGGYARYLTSPDLAAELEQDFADLRRQGARDQAVAALHGAYFSMPYLDVRVVRAARSIPAAERVRGGVRKYPLRVVAQEYIPAEIARAEKKAMQYGSGIWRIIQRLARQNGYKKSVQGYLTEISRAEHGN